MLFRTRAASNDPEVHVYAIQCNGTHWLWNFRDAPVFDRNRGFGVRLTNTNTWTPLRVWVPSPDPNFIMKELERIIERRR